MQLECKRLIRAEEGVVSWVSRKLKLRALCTGESRVPRAIWSGAISFGLVNVPVKLYSAASSKDVRFNQLHDADGARIQLKRVCSLDGEEVPAEHIVRGYEVSPDRYVEITDEELEALEVKGTRTIDIEAFVELSQIDPVYFERSYYLAPDETGAKAYRLLVDAMADTQRVAMGRLVMRTKQYSAAIRAVGPALSLATLYYADEVTSPEDIEGMEAGEVKTTKRELDMARQLIETLATDFQPETLKDEYREKLMALIEEKASGKEVVAVPKSEQPKAPAVDLMAALEASIAAARRPEREEARSSGARGPSHAAKHREKSRRGS